jgi:hypothetical protein
LSYKILCDSPNCEKEAGIPRSNMVPRGWILIKREETEEAMCSIPCLLDAIRGSVTKNESEPVETPQPPIKEAIRTVSREGYDRKRRELLSRHSLP